MEKDKSQSLGVNFLPPSGRNLGSSLPYGNNENPNSEPLGSTTIPPIRAGIATESVHFSHDISRMPDNPPRHLGHRRAHSEIVTLPDDLNFDSDLGVLGVFDGPSYSDDTEEDLFSAYLDMYRFNSASATSASQLGESSSSAAPSATAATPLPENHVHSSGERPRIKHQHSVSMDGSSTINPEMLTSGPAESSSTVPKKSMPADKLAELALVDPKRAKRMWANRQSAARSKERKIRYIAELERKVHALQIEATSLSAQLTLLQSDTNGLTVENSELKLRLQTMEQQVHLQDALNDALKEEIQHLKVVAGQNLMNGGSIMNFRPSLGPNQQFHPNNNQTMRTQLTAHQFQQLQIQRPFQPQQLHQFHNSSEFNPHAPRD